MLPYISRQVENFISSIPPNTNAYLKTAEYLKALLVQPRPVPQWAKWFDYWVIVAAILMLVQGGYLLYLRIRTRRLQIFGMNSLALFKIEISNAGTILSMSYSALTVVDRIFRQFVRAGFQDQSKQLIIFATKFLVLLMWSCVVVGVGLCLLLCLDYDKRILQGSESTAKQNSVRDVMAHELLVGNNAHMAGL
ncbi:hypothetical protein CROQUDRAFT_214478 [Cronartium quercuum f. sp. fusiforme G11]|uniref:Uncharacterized protein n=1 Tax=Cronartium quercuum f. sp. fusiforme G11 TaxID=708437 RepID=A0A9P6NVT9_9BASI|nr:hypothetical protein CROQUDRAFT_214478 [Cronartium quercuum f. sp. fusiforme G11]